MTFHSVASQDSDHDSRSVPAFETDLIRHPMSASHAPTIMAASCPSFLVRFLGPTSPLGTSKSYTCAETIRFRSLNGDVGPRSRTKNDGHEAAIIFGVSLGFSGTASGSRKKIRSKSVNSYGEFDRR